MDGKFPSMAALADLTSVQHMVNYLVQDPAINLLLWVHPDADLSEVAELCTKDNDEATTRMNEIIKLGHVRPLNYGPIMQLDGMVSMDDAVMCIRVEPVYMLQPNGKKYV